MNKNMTALVSAFARLYHIKNSNIKIYNDMYAEKIITEDEYYEISTNMKSGISFFNPNYKGTDPLKLIVNNNLAPSVLARSIFNEYHLFNEINLGLKQYIILASGYDTSAFKYPLLYITFCNSLQLYCVFRESYITGGSPIRRSQRFCHLVESLSDRL